MGSTTEYCRTSSRRQEPVCLDLRPEAAFASRKINIAPRNHRQRLLDPLGHTLLLAKRLLKERCDHAAAIVGSRVHRAGRQPSDENLAIQSCSMLAAGVTGTNQPLHDQVL